MNEQSNDQMLDNSLSAYSNNHSMSMTHNVTNINKFNIKPLDKVEIKRDQIFNVPTQKNPLNVNV